MRVSITAKAAIAFVVLSAAAAQAQQDCLDFPQGGNLDPYYESWQRAEKTVARVYRGEDPSPKELDDAIRALREAIAENSTSGLGRDRQTGRQFPYHPYLDLATLEAKRGRTACVGPLLAREQIDRVPREARASAQANYDNLMQGVRAWEADSAYRTLAADVKKLRDTNQLSEEGRVKAEALEQLIAQLGPGDSGLRTRIAQEITGLASIERGRIRDYFDAIRVGAPGVLANIDEAQCAEPASTEDSESLRSIALQTVVCMATGVEAFAAAGPSVCSALRRELEETRSAREVLRNWGGDASSSVDNLPAICLQNAWDENNLARLARQFSEIGFQQTQSSYREQRDGFRRETDRLRQSYVATLRSHGERILVAPNACEAVLPLRGANAELRSLRSTIRTAQEDPNLTKSSRLTGIGAEVDAATQRLRAQAASGADQLLSQKQEMDAAGEDTAPFERLESARRGLDGGDLTGQVLTAVCDAAGAVMNEVILPWGEKNVPLLTGRSAANRTFLSSVSALTGPAGVDCVGGALQALPRGGPSGVTVGKWVTDTNASLTDAQACLGDYFTARGAWIDSVESELTRAVDALSRLDGLEDLPSDRLNGIREELETPLRGLTGAQAVLGLPAEASEAEVREGLRGAGIDPTAGNWQNLGSLREQDVPAALQVIRAELTEPLVAAASAAVFRWSARIDKLITFAALDTAFSRFADGDVDRAIVDLREWTPEANADPETLALRHVALSFFLHTKWSLLPEDKRQQRVGTLLYEDANREALAAFRSVPGLQLPGMLDDDARFKQFVTNCCM